MHLCNECVLFGGPLGVAYLPVQVCTPPDFVGDDGHYNICDAEEGA